jgi:hypothetical protein
MVKRAMINLIEIAIVVGGAIGFLMLVGVILI